MKPKYLFLICLKSGVNLFHGSARKNLISSDVIQITTDFGVITNTEFLGKYNDEPLGAIKVKLNQSDYKLVDYTHCNDCVFGDKNNGCTKRSERETGILNCGIGKMYARR